MIDQDFSKTLKLINICFKTNTYMFVKYQANLAEIVTSMLFAVKDGLKML